MREVNSAKEVIEQVGMKFPKRGKGKSFSTRNPNPIEGHSRNLVSIDRQNGNQDMVLGSIVNEDVNVSDKADWEAQEEQVRDGLDSGETE